MSIVIKKKREKWKDDGRPSHKRKHVAVPGNNAGKKPKPDRLTPKAVPILPEPTYDRDEPFDSTLRDEQQVARVEILMAKGVRDRRQLMALLEVADYRQMDRYMKRVQARWEIIGSTQDFARHRGEGLVRLDLIESELWSSISNEDDPRVKQVALKSIIDLQKQRADLLGLTPKVIERLATTDLGDSVSFTKRVSSHEKLSRVASRMLEMIEDRTGQKAIEHEHGGQA